MALGRRAPSCHDVAVFRSAVLTYEAGGDPARAVALLRALAPDARRVSLLARLPISWPLWPADDRRPVLHLVCPFDGELRSLAAVAAFLRDRGRADHRVTMLSLGDVVPAGPLDLDALAAVAGIRAPVTLARLTASPLDLTDRIEAFA